MMRHSETMSKNKIHLFSFYIDDVSGSAVAVRDAISTTEGSQTARLHASVVITKGYSNNCERQTCYGK